MKAEEQIQKLILDTEKLRKEFADRRDRSGQHDRERWGIDALACSIRLKALRECLKIVSNG